MYFVANIGIAYLRYLLQYAIIHCLKSIFYLRYIEPGVCLNTLHSYIIDGSAFYIFCCNYRHWLLTLYSRYTSWWDLHNAGKVWYHKTKLTVIYSPTITGFQCRTCYRCIELMYLENDHWAYYWATKVAVTMYPPGFRTLTHFDSCLIVSLVSFMHSFHLLLYEMEVT